MLHIQFLATSGREYYSTLGEIEGTPSQESLSLSYEETYIDKLSCEATYEAQGDSG